MACSFSGRHYLNLPSAAPMSAVVDDRRRCLNLGVRARFADGALVAAARWAKYWVPAVHEGRHQPLRTALRSIHHVRFVAAPWGRPAVLIYCPGRPLEAGNDLGPAGGERGGTGAGAG